MSEKLHELTEEELEQVSGGVVPVFPIKYRGRVIEPAVEPPVLESPRQHQNDQQ